VTFSELAVVISSGIYDVDQIFKPFSIEAFKKTITFVKRNYKDKGVVWDAFHEILWYYLDGRDILSTDLLYFEYTTSRHF
jgi:hypothetical protein